MWVQVRPYKNIVIFDRLKFKDEFTCKHYGNKLFSKCMRIVRTVLDYVFLINHVIFIVIKIFRNYRQILRN